MVLFFSLLIGHVLWPSGGHGYFAGRMVTMRKTLPALLVLAVAGTIVGFWASSLSAPSHSEVQYVTTTLGGNETTALTLPTPEPSPGPGVVDEYLEMGTIEIPKLKVEQKLLRGVTLKTFDDGVGWWPGTAVPGGYGNMVLGGHRTTSPKPFRHLELLAPGDEIIVATESSRFVYEVRTTKIVDDSALWIVDQAPGYTATLFACHPVGSTAERIVVFADLVRDE